MVAGAVVNTISAVAEATCCQQHTLLQVFCLVFCLMSIESQAARYTARVLLTGLVPEYEAFCFWPGSVYAAQPLLAGDR